MANEKTKDKLEAALLRLIQKTHLSKISVKMLVEEAGISRNAFYSVFRDMNDLIHYIYWEKIAAPNWPNMGKGYEDYLAVCKIITRKIKNRYGLFFLQAIEMEGQNSLRSYIMNRSVDFEFTLAREYCDETQYDNLRYACEFYASGWIEARCRWIKAGYDLDVDDFARKLTDIRFALLTCFMEEAKKKEFLDSVELVKINTDYRID